MKKKNNRDTTENPIICPVQNVIDNITSSDMKAYVDLSGLTEGEHEVGVLVEGNDSRVTYTSKIKKVKITIFKK